MMTRHCWGNSNDNKLPIVIETAKIIPLIDIENSKDNALKRSQSPVANDKINRGESPNWRRWIKSFL